MLCDDCRKNKASIHLKKVTGTKTASLSLCQKCAKKRGLGQGLTDELEKLALDMNAQLMSQNIQEKLQKQPDENLEESRKPKCEICKTTLAQFSKTGRFGCPSCYAKFANVLPPIIQSIHRGSKHCGRTPASAKADNSTVATENFAGIKELREELERAVATENYEHAAIIRDKIAELIPS